jgi:hypothetical protein
MDSGMLGAEPEKLKGKKKRRKRGKKMSKRGLPVPEVEARLEIVEK